MKSKHFLTAGIFALIATQTPTAHAVTISFFPVSTYSNNTAAMDAALGVSGYTVENFEDTTLISGLSITYTGNGFNTTITSLANVLANSGGWDGSAIVTNDPANQPPQTGSWPSLTTFNYSAGASSIGIGLGGFQSLGAPGGEFPVTDHRLYVNGVAVPGTLENLAGASWTPSRLDRDAYVRIDAGPGETITSIGFENIQEFNGTSDVLYFDHLAVQAAPEPASAALLGLGTLLLAARRRRSAQA